MASEQRMRTVRSGFEFRMCLCRDEEWMIFQFDHFYNAAVRRFSGEYHAVLLKGFAVHVVDLVSVSVSLFNMVSAVEFAGLGARSEYAG